VTQSNEVNINTSVNNKLSYKTTPVVINDNINNKEINDYGEKILGK
jgi:hypothetical protein